MTTAKGENQFSALSTIVRDESLVARLNRAAAASAILREPRLVVGRDESGRLVGRLVHPTSTPRPLR